MDLGLRGHAYLVVGGTRGMGLAAARTLAAEGASVAIAGRDPDAAAAAAKALAAEVSAVAVGARGPAPGVDAAGAEPQVAGNDGSEAQSGAVAVGTHGATPGIDAAGAGPRAIGDTGGETSAGAVGEALIVGLGGDVTVAGEADRVVAQAVRALGGLRGVAITTGLGMRGHQPLLAATDEDWIATFDDVLLATVRVCRAAIPFLVDGGGGSLVTTAAYSIRSPKPHQAPYGALKAAVATLTKNLAKAHGPSGVRANCVCPGATETEVLAAMRVSLAAERGWPVESALEQAMVEDWGMQVALGRAGRPEEVGDVIAFLLSERASYLTGALVNVDGGTDF